MCTRAIKWVSTSVARPWSSNLAEQLPDIISDVRLWYRSNCLLKILNHHSINALLMVAGLYIHARNTITILNNPQLTWVGISHVPPMIVKVLQCMRDFGGDNPGMCVHIFEDGHRRYGRSFLMLPAMDVFRTSGEHLPLSYSQRGLSPWDLRDHTTRWRTKKSVLFLNTHWDRDGTKVWRLKSSSGGHHRRWPQKTRERHVV